MRTPLVIAANGGLSAHVDAFGNVLTLSERQRPEFLVETVVTPQRRGKYPSLYARWGDWFAIVCVLCCIALAVSSLADKYRARRAAPGASPAESVE